MANPRSFPPPWTVEERAESFVVCDAEGQALGYFYFEDDLQRRLAAKRLMKDEARVMAASFAKLPDLLMGGLRREATRRLLALRL
jgi:hypothetical protein